MSPESSRDSSVTGKRAPARRIRGFQLSLLSLLAAALLGPVGPVRAQGQPAGGLLIPPGGLVAGKSVKALVAEQVKRMPAGKGAERRMVETRQILIVDLDGNRLYMADYDRNERGQQFLKQHIQVILDEEHPRVYTLTADGGYYKEHSGDLNDQQHERDIAEANEIELGNGLSRREREAFFEKNCHLRPDGTREVVVDRKSGETILGRDCEHLVVKENCRTVIDAQVTSSIPGARNYYQLYRRLGAFSEEVLEKLRDLGGVPLKAKINVVTALTTFPLEVETKRLDVRQVPAAFFELPPSAQPIPEETGTGRCPRCGKEFEQELGAFVVLNDRKVLVCSEECAIAYQLEQLEKLKKQGQKPSPKTGK